MEELGLEYNGCHYRELLDMFSSEFNLLSSEERVEKLLKLHKETDLIKIFLEMLKDCKENNKQLTSTEMMISLVNVIKELLSKLEKV